MSINESDGVVNPEGTAYPAGSAPKGTPQSAEVPADTIRPESWQASSAVSVPAVSQTRPERSSVWDVIDTFSGHLIDCPNCHVLTIGYCPDGRKLADELNAAATEYLEVSA